MGYSLTPEASDQFLVIFKGEGEGFAVIGVEVGAAGEFGEYAVVEVHLLVIFEDVGEERRGEATVATKNLRAKGR